MQLPHWTLEGSPSSMGYVHDNFCVRRLYHVIVSRNVPSELVGWHVSVRPFCSQRGEVEPTPPVSRWTWYPDVEAFFGLVGKEFYEGETSDAGVVHFYEVLPKGNGED